jgi:tRNA(Phe) wybutosine-synthesizing methylase Tyw3
MVHWRNENTFHVGCGGSPHFQDDFSYARLILMWTSPIIHVRCSHFALYIRFIDVVSNPLINNSNNIVIILILIIIQFFIRTSGDWKGRIHGEFFYSAASIGNESFSHTHWTMRYFSTVTPKVQASVTARRQRMYAISVNLTLYVYCPTDLDVSSVPYKDPGGQLQIQHKKKG